MSFFYSFIYGCGNYVDFSTSPQFSITPESSIHYKVFQKPGVPEILKYTKDRVHFEWNYGILS